jgi:hypothetical protein
MHDCVPLISQKQEMKGGMSIGLLEDDEFFIQNRLQLEDFQQAKDFI